MEMPRLDENHARLARLAGRWLGDETIFPSPWGPGATCASVIEARMAVDGFFLLTDYEQMRDGKVSFRGHSIHGFDPHRKLVTWYWVDSMGLPPPAPASGGWEGDALVLTQQTPHGQSRYTWRLDGPDRYAFAIESSKDGAAWQRFMEGRHRRG